MAAEKHPITSRSQWLALRSQDLTASDVGGVLGCDPREGQSHLNIYLRKTGQVGEKEETRAMRRGRRDEPAIIAALKEERPAWTLKTAKVYLRDPSIRLGATPDCFAEDPKREGFGVVQCKSVALDVWLRGWCGGSRDNPPEPPMPYLLQTLTEAHLAELAFPGSKVWCCLAVHVRSAYEEDLHIIEVPRDERAEQSIRELCQKFWADIEAGRVPPADFAQDGAALSILFPRETKSDYLDLTTDNELGGLVADYVEARQLRSEIEDQLESLATRFKDKLRDAAGARIAGGGEISWKTQHRDEYVVPAKDYRVLRVKGAKKEKPKEAEAA